MILQIPQNTGTRSTTKTTEKQDGCQKAIQREGNQTSFLNIYKISMTLFCIFNIMRNQYLWRSKIPTLSPAGESVYTITNDHCECTYTNHSWNECSRVTPIGIHSQTFRHTVATSDSHDDVHVTTTSMSTDTDKDT